MRYRRRTEHRQGAGTVRRRLRIGAALASALMLSAASACVDQADGGEPETTGNRVTVDSGELRGTLHAGHRLFQGIPYAAPPKGELRWAPPQLPSAWDGIRDATEPGSPCPQVAAAFGGTAVLEEDCLFLNVTTPREVDPGKPLPVMVWIHGNGAIGSGDVFNAAALAERGNVIVVTLNYRMGVFGAFGHPELAESGVLGLQDQRAALKWVQRNAAAFGGDADNVTLFGVSFGATATAAHLISSQSQGLFHKAIMHSGFAVMDAPAGAVYPYVPALEWYGWKSDREVRELGAAIAPELGCGDPGTALDYLRKKSVRELLAYPSIMNLFQPYAFGNAELPTVPLDSLRDGHFPRVPVLAGSTRDEHRTFVAIREMTGSPITTGANYTESLVQAFGDEAARVEQEYPLSDYENAEVAFSAVMTDRMWAQATHRQNTLLSRRTPLYFYEFADRRPPAEFPFPPSLPSGAYHNSDISYLFRTPEFAAQLTPDQLQLSNAIMAYWATFAHHGDPNTVDLPNWPLFDDAAHVQSLTPGAITGVDYAAEHRLAFWKQIS